MAAPGSKGYIPTPPPQHQATTLAMAMTVAPLTQAFSLTVPLMPGVEEQAHSASPKAPQVTDMAPDLILGATLPSFGAPAVTAGVPPTVSGAPRKSTTQRAAVLSKKVSPPTLISDSVQGGFTELTPTVSHALTALVTEAEGPRAVSVPLMPTTYPLSWVSARTASREGPLVPLPQLAEAHGTPAGLQPQEDLVHQATTEQSGRSAPAQSMAEGSMEAEANTSATCVVSDLLGPSVHGLSPRPGLLSASRVAITICCAC